MRLDGDGEGVAWRRQDREREVHLVCRSKETFLTEIARMTTALCYDEEEQGFAFAADEKEWHPKYHNGDEVAGMPPRYASPSTAQRASQPRTPLHLIASRSVVRRVAR